MSSLSTKILGTVAMEPKGEYSAEAYYEKLNTVLYNDSTYMAIKPSHNILPTDTEYWQLIGGGAKKEEIVQVFDTVADMKLADLKDGMTVQTLGYYAVNDGGGAKYVIVDDNNLVEDGGSIHELNNQLKAKLIIEKEGVSPAQFGAYTNNSSEGITTQAFQNCINYCQNNNVHMIDNGKSVYKINGTLEITKRLSMNLNYSIIKATTSDSILSFNESLYDDTQYTGNSHHGKISNIILDCNSISLKGIEVISAPRRIIENIRVTNVPGTQSDTGYAYFLSSEGVGAQLKFVNCYADNKTPNNYATVVYNGKSDIVFDGLDYVGFSKGIHHTGGNCYYNNCHGFITAPYNVSYPNSYFAMLDNTNSQVVFNNPYPDTQKYGFYVKGVAPRLEIVSMRNYHNINIATKECIDTYGQAFLLYFESPNLDAFTKISSSIFSSPTFQDDSRSVQFTNLTDVENYYIDGSSIMPRGLDLIENEGVFNKNKIIQINSSRLYRTDREDNGMSKSILHRTGNTVMMDCEFVYNPSIQGKLERTPSVTTKCAYVNGINFSTNFEQSFIANYTELSGNNYINCGEVIVTILPFTIEGNNIFNSRILIMATENDYSNNKGICNTADNTDYYIELKGIYISTL